ncbi:hypothetical protein J0910_00005, partial [Nocardiopsis sp. CNT-189]|uniref:hypothetical protein n=1 Tax=Nocardiopsis oceanisediminis TaxID=2816862 RepID=UPI003B2C7C75
MSCTQDSASGSPPAGGGGRGLTADRVILDEAYNLSDDHMAALLPTMSARPNPQIVYTTSAPDKELAPCEVISRVRRAR